jgi:2-C-methyl-D-erythritol 2,4-cyclodiphosphate synthase
MFVQDGMIGFGYDIHKLADGESLVLGGVPFEWHRGTVAHSDGDVLLHAIMDALLGSLALGDIGYHFPDTDLRYRGVSSMDLLRTVVALLRAEHAHVINIDCMVVLEAPRLRPHIDAMRKNIAEAMGLDVKRVSIKATTQEQLGAIGRGEGIIAYAVAQVEYD